MKSIKTKSSMALLGLLIVSSCAPSGDFCAVYSPVYRDREAAVSVYEIDPAAARISAGNNLWYEQNCN